MGRMIEGLWRVLVKFEHPEGGIGWDQTDPAPYDDCTKVVFVVGLGHPWEVVVGGRVHNVRVTSAMILGPVIAD